MRKRKAQIYSQLFIYVLTVVIVSVILVYGYKSIKSFRERADQISCVKFRNELKNSVDALVGDFASVKVREFSLCHPSTQVCFVETYENPTVPLNTDPIIKDSILSGTNKNVFLIEKLAEESFYIGNISVDPDVMCINPTSSKIRLKIESFGDHVLISK